MIYMLTFVVLRYVQIDRHNSYRLLNGLYFPHHENPKMPLRNTIVDGELVIDVDPQTQQVSRQAGYQSGRKRLI